MWSTKIDSIHWYHKFQHFPNWHPLSLQRWISARWNKFSTLWGRTEIFYWVYHFILLFQRLLWLSNGKRNAQARLFRGIFIYKSVCAVFPCQIFSLPSLSFLCQLCEFYFGESNSKPIIEVKFCEARQNGVPAIGKGKTKT